MRGPWGRVRTSAWRMRSRMRRPVRSRRDDQRLLELRKLQPGRRASVAVDDERATHVRVEPAVEGVVGLRRFDPGHGRRGAGGQLGRRRQLTGTSPTEVTMPSMVEVDRGLVPPPETVTVAGSKDDGVVGHDHDHRGPGGLRLRRARRLSPRSWAPGTAWSQTSARASRTTATAPPAVRCGAARPCRAERGHREGLPILAIVGAARRCHLSHFVIVLLPSAGFCCENPRSPAPFALAREHPCGRARHRNGLAALCAVALVGQTGTHHLDHGGGLDRRPDGRIVHAQADVHRQDRQEGPDGLRCPTCGPAGSASRSRARARSGIISLKNGYTFKDLNGNFVAGNGGDITGPRRRQNTRSSSAG